MGSFSVLNNINGVSAQNQLTLNNLNLSRTLLRLSSGKRVNSGADDAAGLQIADSLQANVRALNQSLRNANDGIATLQIADGALQEIGDLLTRGVTLAEEAATVTTDSTGRMSLENEFRAIEGEINRVATQTNFNGTSIFNSGAGFGGTLHVFVGDLAGTASIAVSIGHISLGGTTSVLDINGAFNTDLVNVHLNTAENAATTLEYLRNAIAAVSDMRGSIGAGMNRLQSAVTVMETQSQNTAAAESGIRDANVAQEVANLSIYQILAQSGIAALGQANSNSQLVLNLLRNL